MVYLLMPTPDVIVFPFGASGFTGSLYMFIFLETALDSALGRTKGFDILMYVPS